MKKIILAILSCVMFGNAFAGRIITDSIKSKVLGAQVKFNVYVPDGFDKSGKQYPVVYLLHGFSDDYRAWAEKGQMQTVVDELIETGEVREMVIFMPNAGGPDGSLHGWRRKYDIFSASSRYVLVLLCHECVAGE